MKLRFCLSLAAALLAIGGVASAQGFTLTFDENGHGSGINPIGVVVTLPAALQNDPGPGGLPNVLTYSLFNPPGLTDGDVILTEPGTSGLSDVIRFNSQEIAPDGSLGALVFYSDNTDGFDSLADTPSLPGAFYPNTIALPEVGPEGNNGITYTPLPGQPGFIVGAGAPVTYVIISDAVPEPAFYQMSALVALGSLGMLRLRRKRAA